MMAAPPDKAAIYKARSFWLHRKIDVQKVARDPPSDLLYTATSAPTEPLKILPHPTQSILASFYMHEGTKSPKSPAVAPKQLRTGSPKAADDGKFCGAGR